MSAITHAMTTDEIVTALTALIDGWQNDHSGEVRELVAMLGGAVQAQQEVIALLTQENGVIAEQRDASLKREAVLRFHLQRSAQRERVQLAELLADGHEDDYQDILRALNCVANGTGCDSSLFAEADVVRALIALGQLLREDARV